MQNSIDLLYLTTFLMLFVGSFHIFGNTNHADMNIHERKLVLHTFMITYMKSQKYNSWIKVFSPLSFLLLFSPLLPFLFPFSFLLLAYWPFFLPFSFLLQYIHQIKCVPVTMVLWVYQMCSREHQGLTNFSSRAKLSLPQGLNGL